MKPYSNCVLWLSRSIDLNKIEIVKTLFEDVAARFVPNSRAGFSLGDGAIQAYSLSESVRITMKHDVLTNVMIRFESRTRHSSSEPISQEMDDMVGVIRLARFLSAIPFASNFLGKGLKIDTDIRREAQNVAGRSGISIALTNKYEPDLAKVMWYFDGTIGSSVDPEIYLEGSTDSRGQKALALLWADFLSSIRALPDGRSKSERTQPHR